MKLRNKLILSCAALAAVATTAVSTTFAWYTANDEVRATNITAGTQSNADTTLLISTSGAQRTWGAKADLGMIDTQSLVPVSFDGTNYHVWDKQTNDPSSTNVDASAVNSTGKYIGSYLSFMLYFKSGTSESLNVGVKSIKLVNTTPTLGTKTTLTTDGLAISTPTYTIDAFRALTFATNSARSTEVESGFAAQTASAAIYEEVAVTVGTTVVTGLYTKSGDTYTQITTADTKAVANTTYYKNVASQERKAYSIEGYRTLTDSLNAVTTGTPVPQTDTVSGYNAHQYYNTVKGLEYSVCSATITDTASFNTAKNAAKGKKLYKANTTYETVSITGETDDAKAAAFATAKAANQLYTRSGDAEPYTYTKISATATYDATATYYKVASVTYAEATAYEAGTVYYVKDALDVTKENSETLTALPKGSSSDDLPTAISLGYTGAGATGSTDAVLAVRFDIYLDGWDLACFDACQGQSFTLEMEFQVIQ